jgi:hypothetical protein
MGVRNPNCFLFHYFSIYLGVQLIHNSANAASTDDADDGLIFIQQMMDLMKNTNGIGASSESNHHLPLSVFPLIPSSTKPVGFSVGPAQFGKRLHGTLGVNKSI